MTQNHLPLLELCTLKGWGRLPSHCFGWAEIQVDYSLGGLGAAAREPLCSIMSFLDPFQQSCLGPAVWGLQSVLQQAPQGTPRQVAEMLSAPGRSRSSVVHCSALCGAASE